MEIIEYLIRVNQREYSMFRMDILYINICMFLFSSASDKLTAIIDTIGEASYKVNLVMVSV